MAKAAKEVLEAKSLQVLADAGYYSSADLKACEDDGIEAYVPPSEGNGVLEKQGRSAARISVMTPQPMPTLSGRRTAASDKSAFYQYKRPGRDPLSEPQGDLRHLPVKATLPHTEVSSTHHRPLGARRMQGAGADDLMRRRSGIVEHPFGTTKCRAGHRHFLVRGFDKVRGEWSLMALCYNFTRVLNILGFEGFAACMAKAFRSPSRALPAASGCIQLLLETFWTNMHVWFPIKRFGPSSLSLPALLAQPRRGKAAGKSPFETISIRGSISVQFLRPSPCQKTLSFSRMVRAKPAALPSTKYGPMFTSSIVPAGLGRIQPLNHPNRLHFTIQG
jgi:hypothetical protein